MKIKAILFFVISILMFSNVMCMTPIDKKFLSSDDVPGPDMLWLMISDKGNSVLIRLKKPAKQPEINLANLEEFNFEYIDEDGTPLPKGLYYWKDPIFKNFHRGIIDAKGTKVAFSEKGAGGYYGVWSGKRHYFDTKLGYTHPSPNFKNIVVSVPPVPVPPVPVACVKWPAPGANHLLRSQIFEYLFGKSEVDFYDTNKPTDFANAFVKNGDEHLIQKSESGKITEFGCGYIDLKKLSDFKKDLKKPGKKSTPSFNVVFYEVSNIYKKPPFEEERKFRKFADVGAMQGRPENRDAVFQVASRLHCLEGGCTYRGAGGPAFMGDIGSSAVQGEESSISAAPGGIFRMYGPTMINLFKETPFRDLVNPLGKNMPTVEEVLAVKNVPDNWADNLLICFHKNITVITGLSAVHRKGDSRDNNSNDCNELIPTAQNQIIHQVPVSAFSLKVGRGKDATCKYDDLIKAGNKDQAEKLKRLSQDILNASYEGTIAASIVNNKNKIFLTAVGAGDFRNKPEWVVEAIKRCKTLINDYGLNVYFVFMAGSQPGDTDLPKEFEGILDLVKEIGGNYLKIRFKDEKETALWISYEGNNKDGVSKPPYIDPVTFEGDFKTILQPREGGTTPVPKQDDQINFFDNVQDGDLNAVNALIGKVDVNAIDGEGWTPLMLAADNGHVNVVEALLKAGADKDKIGKDGDTPLILAVLNGHVNVVEALLQAGADKDKPGKDGDTPLILAVLNGHVNVVEALLKAGADKDKPGKDGWTPLMRAVGRGHKDVVEVLLSKGADKDKVANGWTSLMGAALSGRKDIVEALLNAGADVNKVNKEGQTALTIAQGKGFKEIVALLQPAAPAGNNQLQAKLARLKTNLAALKGKLGALSGKLGVLKGKLVGAK